MKRLFIIAAAACMLASCGSSDNSGTVLSKNDTSAVSAAASEQSGDVAKQHGNYEKYPTGYYRVPAGTQLYDMDGNPVMTAGTETLCRGGWSKNSLELTMPVENGQNELGEKQYRYGNYYIKDEAAMLPVSVEDARQKVVDYALEMSRKPKQTYTLSGEYVGEDETRSDCSGMTELAYLQIGLYLEHYTVAQANNGGTAVFDNIEKVGEDQGNEVYRVKDGVLTRVSA